MSKDNKHQPKAEAQPDAGSQKFDPLDHDRDGRKGGSLPHDKQSTEPAALDSASSPVPDAPLVSETPAPGTAPADAAAAAAAVANSGETNAKPSTVETMEKLGKQDDSMTEKSEAEIAEGLRASMEAGLTRAVASAEDEVEVTVPKSFFLRLADQTLVSIKAGTKTLPRAHAEHPYSKDNGVTLSGDVPDRAYADAAAEIVRGEMELDYAVNGISRHFKASADQVRAELTARMEKLKGAP